MQTREIIRELKEKGFILVRTGQKHKIFEKDGQRICVSHGRTTSWRTINAFKVKMKRLEEKPIKNPDKREVIAPPKPKERQRSRSGWSHNPKPWTLGMILQSLDE